MNPYPETITDESTGQVFEDKEHRAYQRGWDDRRASTNISGGMCPCGNPQSHPIPHEHDRTERENRIIEHYENLSSDREVVTKELYEALKEADEVICQLCKHLNPHHAQTPFNDGCEYCGGREPRLRALAHYEEGK